MSFKLKLLLTFIIYGFSLVVFTQVVVYKLSEENIKSESIKKASALFLKKNKYFELHIKNTNLKISAIKNSTVFKKYQYNPTSIDELETLFLDIARSSDNIMQLRYLDKDGLEKIRVDRNFYSSNPFLVSKDKLQNKSNRYYFKEALKSTYNSFWYSNLDLNKEYGKIEEPIKPVLRVATKTVYNSEDSGIIIVNLFMKEFLQEFVDSPFNNIYIFDKDGEILVDSMNKSSWSKYLNKHETIMTEFKDENLKELISEDIYISEDMAAGRIFLNNGEKLHMIVKPKEGYIEDRISRIMYESIFIIFVVIIISLPLAYFFAKLPVRLKSEVDAQKEEQDILLSLFDLGDAVLFKWNYDDKRSINSVSKSVEKLLGYEQNEFENNSISYMECIHPDDLKVFSEEVIEAINSKVYFFEPTPYRVIKKDEEVKWILDNTVVVRNNKGDIINLIGYLTDITELKNNEFLLEKISRTDKLTQISNRMQLDELLQGQYYRFNRDNELCSIIMIDIDYFKSVNDEYGHLVGDTVLIEIATLLNESIRTGDTVGRWGGEEFLIILPHTSLSQALLLAEKLRVLVSEHSFTTVGHKTASFGVAVFVDDMSIETLTDRADKALYKSKDQGRNCISTI